MTDIRARARTALHRLPRGRIALWIGASCLLLVIAGAMQVRWISQSNQSRRLLAEQSLDKSMRLAIEDLEFKVWLLLALFQPDPVSERAAPVEYYRERLYMWQSLSQHGPAIQRVLVYDMDAEDSKRLTELELFLGPERFMNATWDEDLVHARQYIQEHGFPSGRGLKARRTVTWMFHPEAMVLLRPIVAHEPSSRIRVDWPAVRGYLILKLDANYIQGRLIPDTLNRRFGTGPRKNDYTIDLALDGNALIRYEPDGNGGSVSHDRERLAIGYSQSRLDERDSSGLPRDPDQSYPLLLDQKNLSQDLLKLGAAQQVWVERTTYAWRTNVLVIAPPGPLWSPLRGQGIHGVDLADVLRRAAADPRLFVVGEKQHQLSLEARHVGLPLAEAINQEQTRPLAVSVIAFVLLLATTITVVVARGLVARSAELKTDAAASLAHQLLTPITAIVSLGDNMARGGLGRGDKTLEYGGLIHRYGQRLQTIVDRAMQMSAMDRFERRFDLAMLDVSKVAERAMDDLSFVIEDAGFSAERALATDLPKVQADMEALQQAIADLIGNAVKYGSPGCWLKVETALAFAGSGQEVQIRVHDRGPGIPARDASRIFEPYYRIDNRISKSRPGAGLGLKLVVEMVKGMGGTVSLESEEGRGSVFTIHLPVPTA